MSIRGLLLRLDTDYSSNETDAEAAEAIRSRQALIAECMEALTSIDQTDAIKATVAKCRQQLELD